MNEAKVGSFKSRPIGKNLKLTSGFPFPSKFFSTADGFPLIRIRDILSSSVETYYASTFDPAFVVKNGDVLVGMDGDFNIVRWRNVDALLNQRVLKIEVSDNDEYCLGYVYYWLQPFLKKLNDVTAATTVKHLSTGDLKKAVCLFPDVDHQKKIAAILETVDLAIEQTEALIAKYEQVKAGMMQDLFTRGLTPEGKLRPTRQQAPNQYQNTPIGWIPTEWEIAQVIDLAQKQKGSTVIGPFGSDLVMSDYRSAGVPVVFVRDVSEDAYKWVSSVYVSKEKAQKLFAHRVTSGDILITKMGLPPCVACVYPKDQEAGVITADIIRMTPDTSVVDTHWLCSALNFDRTKRQVATITAGVTRPKVTLADFRSLRLAVPKPWEQTKVSKAIGKIQAELDAFYEETTKLGAMKSGLMHDLLTGKVAVKV